LSTGIFAGIGGIGPPNGERYPLVGERG